MIAVSDAARQRLTDYMGDWLISLAFTLSSGETLTVTRNNVWGGSLALEDAVGSSGAFEIGSTHINQMKVTLFDDDGAYDSKNFLNASVIVNLGWHSGALLVKGYYTIVDVQKSDGLITLTGYDYMDKFSRLYSLSTRTYPCTLKQIVAEACTFCGVTDGTGNFDHYNQTIQTKPNDDMLTFREVIGYVAQIAGYNARIARNGRLQFVRYNLGGFDTEGAYNTVTDVYSDRIEQDEINITGIHVDEENAITTTDSEGIKTTSLVTTGYDAGTDGYVLSISGNPLIKNGLGQNVANWLFSAFGNKPFRIGSVTHASDPCIEASDIMKVTDRHGTYNMLVSETIFSTGSPQTSNSYATSPRSTDAVQYSNLDKIKTVASEAHIVAMAAQGYANEAQRSANQAQASADSAATAAQTAWNHADDANTAAQTAWDHADDALTAAGNAQASANAAATAASNAQTSANNAQTSANDAQAQAELATGYAGNALIQLSEVEQVANILNWIAQHGTYSKTSDTAIVQNKNYYTKFGDVYTLVTEPDVADIGNYYELHIDEAISNYVSTHLALTNDGLYVIKGVNDYRLRITNNAFQVIDANGTAVATYGTSISFDPTKEYTIGNSSNYLKFFDSDGDGIADSIAIIANQILLGNKDVGDAIDSLENMEIGGRNLLHNTNVIDLSKHALRPNINGDNASSGYLSASSGTLTAATHGVKITNNTAIRPGFLFGTNTPSASGTHGLAVGREYTFSCDWETKTLGGSPVATTTYYLRAYLYYATSTSASSMTQHSFATWHTFDKDDTSDRGAVVSGHGAFTFTVPDDAVAWNIRIYSTNTNTASLYAAGDYLQIENVKLEVGQKGTAWTPAPEDIDSEINGINVYLATLQGQVDGKAETFYQADDPSTNWTAAEKEAHEGDLWYRTGDGVTLRYSGSTWQEQDVPKVVFDEIDGKAQIFISQPTPPYAIGDLWVQGASGDILRCRTAKASGSYSASDWVKASKYTDDSAFTAFRDGTYASFVTATNQTLNSKVTTFYQTSQPTASATGDLWIDTDDGNKLYRWSGSAWVAVQDSAIQTALTNAADAQSTADSKIVTFAQASQPTATDVGDLWIDTDDQNKMYRWSGSSWVAVTDASAVAELEIGGKNKLTGTNSTIALTATGTWEDRTWRKAGGGTGTITYQAITDAPDKTLGNGWQIDVESVSNDSYGQSVAIGQNRVKVVAGQQYTLSCYAKGSGQLYMFSGIISYRGGQHDVTSDWQRYSTTFTAGTTSAYVNDNGANVFFGASVAGTSITICGMQLESGNKASAWNPAPEDIESDISNVEINLANTKTAFEDDIYGDVFWQYTAGGTTYDVWLDESTGNYTYVDDNGDLVTVAYADLDVDTETGEKATTRKGGMLDNIEVINGSILIDNNEPSVTIQAVKKTNSGTVLGDSKLKLLSERISFEKNGTEVMYLDSTEDDGVIDINSARVHNSLKIGHLELFDHNGGIGIRRWD